MRSEAEVRRAPFAAGDVAVLYDRRRRRYRIELREGGTFGTHVGEIPHAQIIGRNEGFTVLTSRGHRLLVFRPTFREAVLELPRQSQVIYPKDLGTLLSRGDIYPGARVVELGMGSGATAAAILRAIGPSGSLTSYEVRENIVEPSKRNVAKLAPDAPNHVVVVADAYEADIGDGNVDRVITDIPEPWRTADAAAKALRTGGIYFSYLPTILQVHQLTVALTQDQRWRLVETVEIMEREWHVTDVSVRPEHRMVGHTGFLTTARRSEPLPGQDEEAEATNGEPADGAPEDEADA